MASTFSRKPRKSDFCSVDWFQAHREAEWRTWYRAKSQKRHEFKSYLWPTSEEYYSPLSPIFVSVSLNPTELNLQSEWLARDGLIPLLWFFKRNPNPGNFKQRLFVHEEFSPYVPTVWRKQVGSYRVVNSRVSMLNKPNKIFLTGMVSDSTHSLDFLDSNIECLLKTIGKDRLAKMEKYFFFIQKDSRPGENKKCDYFSEYMLRIFKKFGTKKITMLNWNSFETIQSFEEFFVSEFNERLLNADNFVVHSALQRGGSFLDLNGRRNQNAEEKFVRLSPYHGLLIQEQLRDSPMLDLYKKSLKSAEKYFLKIETGSRINLSLPWPTWIVPWSKTISQKQEASVNI